MTSVQEDARDDQIEEHSNGADAPEPRRLDRDQIQRVSTYLRRQSLPRAILPQA